MQKQHYTFQKLILFLSLLLGNSLPTALALELHPPPTAATDILKNSFASIFSKPNYSFSDVLRALHPANPLPTYIFSKETKLSVHPINQGKIDYSDSRYLTYLGYADYLTMPITTLYEKAKNNDIKAQFIYALFWQEMTKLDPSSNGLTYFKDIIQAIADQNNDAKLWLGVIYDSESKTHEAIQLYTNFLKNHVNPIAQYQLAMLILKNNPQKADQKQACQLLQQASASGLDLAQYNYGVCLYIGEGLARDRKRGEYYLALAAANNVPNALEWFQTCKVDSPKIERDRLIYKSCQQK
jgi:hypothetical protein